MWRRVFMGRVEPGNLDSRPIIAFQCEMCFNIFPRKARHACAGSESQREVGDEAPEINLA